MSGSTELKGPDLGEHGIAATDLADGAMVEGHAAGKAVLLVRRGAEVFALGALCTHYGAPLADGTITGDVVRCPWHHATFDVRCGPTGAVHHGGCRGFCPRDARQYRGSRCAGPQESDGRCC